MVQKVFKPLKFYCTCISHPVFESLRTGLMYIHVLTAARQQNLPISMLSHYGRVTYDQVGVVGRGRGVSVGGGGGGGNGYVEAETFFYEN